MAMVYKHTITGFGDSDTILGIDWYALLYTVSVYALTTPAMNCAGAMG